MLFQFLIVTNMEEQVASKHHQGKLKYKPCSKYSRGGDDSKRISDDTNKTKLLSYYHKDCFDATGTQFEFFKGPKSPHTRSIASNRSNQHTAGKNASVGENGSGAKPYTAATSAQMNAKLKRFELERQDLLDQLAAEKDNASNVEVKLKSAHDIEVAELQVKIAHFESMVGERENELFEVRNRLEDAKLKITSLEQCLHKKGTSVDMENSQTHEIFQMLSTYFQENAEAWNEVERICRTSNEN